MGKFLAGVQSCDGSGSAAFDGQIHAVQVIQIVQHQQLHFHNGSLFFADLHFRLLIEGGKLLAGSLQSGLKLGFFQSGVAGGNGQGALRLAVDHRRANGYAGKYRQTDTFLHIQLLTLPEQ